MTLLLTILGSIFSTRIGTMVLVLTTCTVVLVVMAFFHGQETKEKASLGRFAHHHFETLKEVNDEIDDLGHPTGNDLRCLLKQRGEIRESDNLLCP